MRIPLKLYRCLGYSLNMCIMFGYNPQIIFVTFSQKNLVSFSVNVNRYKVSCVCISSYSFMQIPLKLYKCLGDGLKMYTLFGHNPHIIFVAFVTK